jgi:hypothetical protein
MNDGWRKFFTVVLGIVFVLTFVGFVLGIVVRRDLLSPDLYVQAFVENDAYTRVYTDVFSDPLVQDRFKEATGLQIDLLSEELYAQVVGALYLILPPPQLQASVEQFLANLTGYLKGDVPELQENLQLGSALTPDVLAGRLVTAGTAVASGAVDLATPFVENKTETLIEDDLVAYLDQFNEGRLIPIPQRLLRTTVSGITSARAEELITLMLGPAAGTTSDQTKLQMEAALADDDLPTAISLAINERLTLLVTARLAAAEPQLAQTEALIGISGAAQAVGQTRDDVVAGLNAARGYVMLLRTIFIVLAVVMLIAILLIVWLNSDDLRSALRAAGWTLVAASGLVLLLWLVGGFFLRSMLQAQLAATAVGPAGLDAIIDDVAGSLVRGVWGSVWTTALWFLLIGLVLLAIGYISQLTSLLERLLAPVWEYKWWVLGGVLGVFVLLPLLWRMATADARAANLPCNGYVELCDRPINEVAFASSHNAMSITEYGWLWPMHDGTISDQLEYGVRALLIDTHYMDTPEGQAEGLARLPERLRPVAQKAIDNFRPPSQDGVWLCHEFCALGTSPFAGAMEEVRVFLEQNPREVLFVVIQDEVAAASIEQVIAEAGLLPYIYTHEDGQPWPTLREMIDSGQRLIIMAENEGPPPTWYDNVWNVTEETPYTFIFPEQFSCEPNRGGTGQPFFLLNHWIQRGSPNRVDAAIVNDYDFLLARAQQCAAERGQIPNFVAVNFYSQGDLLNVVNTLNGVGAVRAVN